MKILKVIHGYPPYYNAGSEVYSQTLVDGLAARGHQVEVFSRYENPFEADFSLRTADDINNAKVLLHLVNVARSKDRYQHLEIDGLLGQRLEQFQPDVVHIGHLNHLSTSLVFEAQRRNIPITFTLHDYWLICPRGQFMQFDLGGPELWPACDGQENQKCAEKCYTRYISGGSENKKDTRYWSSWVATRMSHIKEVIEVIDVFIAPSRYLKQRFQESVSIPDEKIVYLDYGFDLDRFSNRKRESNPSNAVVFGYIGTHTPAKGIHLLIEAFGKTKGDAYLKIWGKPRGETTPFLKELASALPQEKGGRITWEGEYQNKNIFRDVFNHTDVIVVPSVWVENSPLVIHEAQQVRLPVITANVGGMAEYVKHETNGLLFEHRDARDLARQMQKFIHELELCSQLGKRGYLYSEDGDIPSIEKHVLALEGIYERLVERRLKVDKIN